MLILFETPRIIECIYVCLHSSVRLCVHVSLRMCMHCVRVWHDWWLHIPTGFPETYQKWPLYVELHLLLPSLASSESMWPQRYGEIRLRPGIHHGRWNACLAMESTYLFDVYNINLSKFWSKHILSTYLTMLTTFYGALHNILHAKCPISADQMELSWAWIALTSKAAFYWITTGRVLYV